jgi:HPt (histidine-containing phosphotransfer) domain-containing protein
VLRNARTARQLAMSAHRLKGAARTAGANGLAEQAGRIEAAAKAESLAGARRAAEGMEALLTETLRAMWSIA